MEAVCATLARVTFQLFIEGELTPIECEWNKLTNYLRVLLNGKILAEFFCEDPYTSDKLPYFFTICNVKFVIRWVVKGAKETFDLEVDGDSMKKLLFLDPRFRLTDEKV